MKFLSVILLFTSALFTPVLFAQADKPIVDPLAPLKFLEGSWEAKTIGGSAGADVNGVYAFVRELRGHVLARHTVSKAGCKGPEDFDCEHSDMLYVYAEDAGNLKAIYFDNEGHTIHYSVTLPGPSKVVFLSDSEAGPSFRLSYELKAGVMVGTFELEMPGHSEWKTYLGWSGTKK